MSVAFEQLAEQALASMSDPVWNNRYDGVNQLSAIGVSVPPNVQALEMNANWCRLVVDSMAEVLTVDGFEGADVPDEWLRLVWGLWQSVNMRSMSHLAHTEALTQGLSYVLVGRGANVDRLQVKVLPQDNVAVEYTDGDVTGAVIVNNTVDTAGREIVQAAYYTPSHVETFTQTGNSWTQTKSSEGCVLVPVVPLVNRMRVTDTAGRSEMELVAPYADAASRTFTLLQFAVETMATPQRWIAGGDFSKFKRKDGSQMTATEIYTSAILMLGSGDAKTGQFEAANLSQIVGVLKEYAEMVSAMTGIPASMLGLTTGHPSSAEAMRAAKERMISRGELKQVLFGDAWESWARIVLAFNGLDYSRAGALSTVWRDIAVPSNSAKAAHLLQAHAQGVISARTARDGLPLSPEQRARENHNDIVNADSAYTPVDTIRAGY